MTYAEELEKRIATNLKEYHDAPGVKRYRLTVKSFRDDQDMGENATPFEVHVYGTDEDDVRMRGVAQIQPAPSWLDWVDVLSVDLDPLCNLPEEIDVTAFVLAMISDPPSADPCDFSCSQAERGAYAGKGSYRSSCESHHHFFALTPSNRDALRSYFKAFGAWTEEEIAKWSDDELAGVLLQDVAGCWRAISGEDNATLPNYEDLQTLLASGSVSSSLYPCNSDPDWQRGPWIFYAGH